MFTCLALQRPAAERQVQRSALNGQRADDVERGALAIVPHQALLAEIHPRSDQEAVVRDLEVGVVGAAAKVEIVVRLRATILEEERERAVVQLPLRLGFPQQSVEACIEDAAAAAAGDSFD